MQSSPAVKILNHLKSSQKILFLCLQSNLISYVAPTAESLHISAKQSPSLTKACQEKQTATVRLRLQR